MASQLHEIWCRGGAEGPYGSGKKNRSRDRNVLVHGHTENLFLYDPLIDKFVGVAPSKGKLY